MIWFFGDTLLLIGKDTKCCADLKTHDERMKHSEKEKYLGDQIDSTGKIKETVKDGVAKGRVSPKNQIIKIELVHPSDLSHLVQ